MCLELEIAKPCWQTWCFSYTFDTPSDILDTRWHPSFDGSQPFPRQKTSSIPLFCETFYQGLSCPVNILVRKHLGVLRATCSQVGLEPQKIGLEPSDGWRHIFRVFKARQPDGCWLRGSFWCTFVRYDVGAHCGDCLWTCQTHWPTSGSRCLREIQKDKHMFSVKVVKFSSCFFRVPNCTFG